MAIVSTKSLLETGSHFGHRKRAWNPKMRPYIFAERNGIHILDVQQTVNFLEEAYTKVRDTVAEGGEVLFVGTKKQARDTIAFEAARAGQHYVNEKWLGGTLTNWQTINRRVEYLKEMEKRFKVGEFDTLKKKERLRIDREINNLNRQLGGIRNMNKLPDLMFIVGTNEENNAIREANRLKIPTIALVDSNCDPDPIDFLIPSNDDAFRPIKLITSKIADAALEGYALRKNSIYEKSANFDGYDGDVFDDEQLLGASTLAKLREIEQTIEAGRGSQIENVTQEINGNKASEQVIIAGDNATISGLKQQIVAGDRIRGHKFAERKEIEAFAFASLHGLFQDDIAYIGNPFVLQAGILRNLPHITETIRKYARVVLPKRRSDIEVAIFALGMDIAPERRQVIHLDPDEEGEIVEFSLTPIKPDQQEIIVEFYHERHWLAQLQFTVSVLWLPVQIVSE